ncbi:MAG: tetratricopeptide repeat protein [Parvibaculum sp.]|nr:tetratricopeptide repeat protein [Parvibaculum sp.]
MSKSDFAADFELALRHHMDGRLADAETGYRAVLAAHPRHAPSLHHLGVLAHQAGANDAAATLIAQAIKISPDYAEALSNLGLVQMAQQRNAEASMSFRRAIALKPDYAEAHYNLGVALDAQGEFEQALTSYETALKLRPAYADAACNRALALHALERPAEAVVAYQKTLTVAPQLVRLHTYLGIALCETGAYAEAVAAFEHGIAAAPEDPATYFCLSEVHAARRDLAASTEALRAALLRMVDAGALSLPDIPPPKRNQAVAHFPEALRAALKCLDAAGIEVFLTAGTLLGAIRNGDFIGFDKDVDLGVSSRVPMADVAAALSTDSDFSGNWRPGGDGVLYCWIWRNRVAIDFFRFYQEGDQVWYGLYRNGHRVKWMHKPFALIDFDWLGMKTRIPEDSEFFLEEVYGPDWPVPDPDCGQWACPNIEGGFPPVCRNLAHADIFKALWKRQRSRARHLCVQALELDPHDDFFAALLKAFDNAVVGSQQGGARSVPEVSIVERMARLSDAEGATPER